VVQRRKAAFAPADIEVLALIGGLIAAGIRHAELADEARERRSKRSSGGTRKVTLTGRPGVVGRALGVAAALRRPRAPANSRPSGSDISTDVNRLRGAFDVAEKAIRGIRDRAQAIGLDQETAFLTTYGHIIDDMRFRERALELAGSGAGVGQALSRVARDVTRTAVSLTRDAFLEDRARDIEDLCDALTMMAGDEKGPDLPTKAILVGDTLTVFDLLVTARTMPAGIALSERATGPRTRALLKLMNVPSVTDVQGLFRWVSDGDVALLDGDHGLLVLNPSKVEIAAVREQRAKSGRGGK
jgi:phosphotransferase system enzyme I (PtsP)